MQSIVYLQSVAVYRKVVNELYSFNDFVLLISSSCVAKCRLAVMALYNQLIFKCRWRI